MLRCNVRSPVRRIIGRKKQIAESQDGITDGGEKEGTGEEGGRAHGGGRGGEKKWQGAESRWGDKRENEEKEK